MELPDGQCRQVQNDDVSARNYPVGSGIANDGTEKYRETSYLPVEATVMATVPVLWSGIYGRVDDGPPQLPAWNITSDLLGLAI